MLKMAFHIWLITYEQLSKLFVIAVSVYCTAIAEKYTRGCIVELSTLAYVTLYPILFYHNFRN